MERKEPKTEESEAWLEARDLNRQGILFLQTGRTGEALERFEQAAELAPMLADSYKNRGDLHMSLERYDDALQWYKKAMMAEKNGFFSFLCGNACVMKGNLREGIEYYNRAAAEGYNGDGMLFFMGLAYEEMGDDAMALRHVRKACAENPLRPDYRVKEISLLLRLNRPDEAEASTEELLRCAPEFYDGYHIRTQLLCSQGRYEEAAAFAKAAFERFPEDAELLYDYARCEAFCGREREAEKLVDAAKGMADYSAVKRRFLLLEAQLWIQKQEWEKAAACCLDCVALERKEEFDSEARFILLNLKLAGEDYASALKEAGEIAERGREDAYYYAALYYRPFCLRRMGRIAEAEALYREAAAFYRKVSVQNPAAVDVYLYRAMCLKDMGEYDKALRLLELVESIRPGLEGLQAIRDEITAAR